MSREQGRFSLESFETRLINPDMYWKGGIEDYLSLIAENPLILASAHQTMYRAISMHGVEQYRFGKEDRAHYRFFDDLVSGGKNGVFGQDIATAKLVYFFYSGACRRGSERRIPLLNGPVGGSKSTMVNLMISGLEHYTRTPHGRLYTHSWVIPAGCENEEQIRYIMGLTGIKADAVRCPIQEDPLQLLPSDIREEIVIMANKPKVLLSFDGEEHPRGEHEFIVMEGEACPFCRRVMSDLLNLHEGDWRTVLRRYVRVERLHFSEVDRLGIGTLHPKDKKDQDATELTGDINWRLVQIFGSEADPRAFDFRRGEYFAGNRGICYQEEALKFGKEFLYDNLHAAQERKVKPKGFPAVHIDTIVIGSTNNPEYERLVQDKTMEALVDRMRRIRVPYVLSVKDERKIYDRLYDRPMYKPGGAKHVAPHTTEMAALAAVVSRMSPSQKHNADVFLKAKLFDGKFDETATEERLQAILKETAEAGAVNGGLSGDGMFGISPRLVMDAFAEAVQSAKDEECVTPYLVLKILEGMVADHSLLQNKQETLANIEKVRSEYGRVIRKEVEGAIAADEGAIEELFSAYITSLIAFKRHGSSAKIKHPITGLDVPYDEKLMRRIETKISVKDNEKDQFRSSVVEAMGFAQAEGRKFEPRSIPRLLEGLSEALFEDKKDYLKFNNLRVNPTDEDERTKLHTVLDRMQKMYGYCPKCAAVTLHLVQQIMTS